MGSAVIADDLTGAADTAVEFAKQGYSAAALLRWEGSVLPTTAVIAADTESRHLPPALAYERVHAAVVGLQEGGFTLVYKKIDSALRGQLGAEIDAALDAGGLDLAVVAPAFPANGRTTVRGRQCDRGVPLEATAFAHDPFSPIVDSCVARVIASQSRRRVGALGLDAVRAGASSLACRLDEERREGSSVLAVDAELDDDLAIIAEALMQLRYPALAVGSAGLAEFYARRLPMPAQVSTAIPSARPLASRVLIVAGSIHPRTRRQVELVAASADSAVISLWPEGVAPSPAWPRAQTLVLRLAGATLPPTRSSGQQLVAHLAARAEEALLAMRAEGLVLVGGDTAVAVLARLKARGLLIEREVQPGMPAGKVLGGSCDGMPVVTKAGGFGNERALLAALAYLRGE